MSILSS